MWDQVTMMTGEGQRRCRAVENPRAVLIHVRSSREEQILLLFVLVYNRECLIPFGLPL